MVNLLKDYKRSCVFVRVFICGYLFVYLFEKDGLWVCHEMDNALAQVLYILFSYIQHQIKQITQVIIYKSTLFQQVIKINQQKKITNTMYKERPKIYKN